MAGLKSKCEDLLVWRECHRPDRPAFNRHRKKAIPFEIPDPDVSPAPPAGGGESPSVCGNRHSENAVFVRAQQERLLALNLAPQVPPFPIAKVFLIRFIRLR